MTVPVSGFVRSYDFVNDRTHDGRLLRILTLIDEYTRECLALRVARRLNSQDVIETLSEVMLWRPSRSTSVPTMGRSLLPAGLSMTACVHAIMLHQEWCSL